MATEFLKAIQAELEEFDYALPDLLKEAEKIQSGKPVEPILIKKEGQHVELYYLRSGRVWFYDQYLDSKSITPLLSPDYGRKPDKKLTYKAFVKNLSTEDTIKLAEKLKELGL